MKLQCFIKVYVESDLRLKLTSFNSDTDSLVGTKQCYKSHWFLNYIIYHAFIYKCIFSCLVKEGYLFLYHIIIIIIHIKNT